MKTTLIGPFRQLLTLRDLPPSGPVTDERLEVLPQAGMLVREGVILKVGPFDSLTTEAERIEEVSGDRVALPGLIDAHTHLCFAGSRARDHSLRLAGCSYLEIARAGGGIRDTVARTRAADRDTLKNDLVHRAQRHFHEGVTTCEVKSGYGLGCDEELRMLEVIAEAKRELPIDLIPTCLAAHLVPPEWDGAPAGYLDHLVRELLPELRRRRLAGRVDIFVEEGAFSVEDARPYLRAAENMGFFLTIHGDQFTTGGSRLACELQAASVDHLEASGDEEIRRLGAAAARTAAVVLPGASLGLGMPYAPARRLLDAGARLVIATDWNPGSAPMGDLLMQAAVLAAAEQLTSAETFAALTTRAASALGLADRGALHGGQRADLAAFPCNDWREILYQQGKLKPAEVWKSGHCIRST